MRDYQGLVAMHWEDFLQVLAQMMAIPSVKGAPVAGAPFGEKPRAALDLALSLGKAWGFKTGLVNEAVAYVEWQGQHTPATSKDYIGIVGHLDVVAAGTGWHYPPFALTQDQETLYGRGILDNKGPIMSCLYGLKLLKDQGYQPDKTVRILLGSDEESGMSDIPLYLAKEVPPTFGFTPDCKYPVVYGERGVVGVSLVTAFAPEELAKMGTIVGEQNPASVPDQLAVTLSDGQTLTATGVRSPSNAPELGKNAITLLAEKLAAIALLAPRIRQYFQWVVTSFHEQHHGEGIDLILADPDSGKLIVTPISLQKIAEDQLELRLSFRYPVTVSEDRVLSGLEKALFPGTQLTVTRRLPSVVKDKDGVEIQKLTQVYEQATGLSGRPVTTTGGTYARKMPNIIAFGPSFPGQKGIAHNHDEYMTVADLQKNLEIYIAAIEALTTA